MDTLFKELAKAFGLTEETIDNFIKELEESKEKYTKTRSESLNPDGKTDEEMKADGWTLEEDVNTTEDGKIFRRRTWTKQSDCPKDAPSQKAEEEEIIQGQLKQVDDWMNILNSMLIHNWGKPDSKYDENYNTILMFIKDILEGKFEDKNPKELIAKYPTGNLYETTDILDTKVLDNLNGVQKIVEDIKNVVPGYFRAGAMDTLKARLTKYVELLRVEAEEITNSSCSMNADTIDISDNVMDEPVYSLVYLWHSMLCEYLSQLSDLVEIGILA